MEVAAPSNPKDNGSTALDCNIYQAAKVPGKSLRSLLTFPLSGPFRMRANEVCNMTASYCAAETASVQRHKLKRAEPFHRAAFLVCNRNAFPLFMSAFPPLPAAQHTLLHSTPDVFVSQTRDAAPAIRASLCSDLRSNIVCLRCSTLTTNYFDLLRVWF